MTQASILSAYMLSGVVMVVCFLLAVLIANMILFKPRDPGVTKRRIWFWILCAATGVIGFLINFVIAQGITIPNVHANYLMHSGIATGVSVVLYIIVGFVLSKIFPKSKIGTWF